VGTVVGAPGETTEAPDELDEALSAYQAASRARAFHDDLASRVEVR
jgi:hypothetical protein